MEKSAGEIYTLAETFNDMLARLQTSFENEKQFTSDASHELRTPLAVIKAECEYALSDNASEEDMLEALSSIDEQTDSPACVYCFASDAVFIPNSSRLLVISALIYSRYS